MLLHSLKESRLATNIAGSSSVYRQKPSTYFVLIGVLRCSKPSSHLLVLLHLSALNDCSYLDEPLVACPMYSVIMTEKKN